MHPLFDKTRVKDSFIFAIACSIITSTILSQNGFIELRRTTICNQREAAWLNTKSVSSPIRRCTLQADRIHVTNAEIEEARELAEEGEAREQKARQDHARLNAAQERQRLEAALADLGRRITLLRQVGQLPSIVHRRMDHRTGQSESKLHANDT